MNDVDICCLVCDDWKNPEWDLGGHVHNWKNYSTEELKNIWENFTDEQKKVIVYTLDNAAEREFWN